MVVEEEVEGVVEQLEFADGSTASNLFSISSSRASTSTCKDKEVKIMRKLELQSINFAILDKARERHSKTDLEFLHMV